MKSAGVNRGTTGEAMVVRNLQPEVKGHERSRTSASSSHRPAGLAASLNTPVLVVDLEALDRNIAEMAAFAAAPNVKLRPHAKTHKSAEIARRQIAAGALGACCAKLGEAEALADGGIDSILITSPVVAPPAIERLMALNGTLPDLMAVVDHPANADALAAAAGMAGKPLT